MTTQSLLTNYAKIEQVSEVYFAPVALLPNGQPVGTLYAFLSHIDPWSDDANPPVPSESQQYTKNVFASMFVAKQIYSSQISPVITRTNWTSGIVYDYYQDNIDMFAMDSNGYPTLHFYAKNIYDQVFKCLWNNNGAPSTAQPYFQPGSYGTNNIFQSSDGYKWKYMYTIDAGSKKSFMDDNWMPVPTDTKAPNPLNSASGFGDIQVINVVNGGTGYDSANATISVVISGDGTGATGSAQVANGSITDIIVSNSGSNYSYANVAIVSALGSNASFVAPASPVGGHASDAVSELGCNHVMLTAEFTGSEGGIIPTDISYRQCGILSSPVAKSTYPNSANGGIYKVSTDIVVAAGFGSFVSGENVYQGISLNSASWTAKVLSFDSTNNIIHVINTLGTPTVSQAVFGATSQTTRTALNINTPDFIPYSGYMLYIQNQSGIQRSSDGIEQFKFVLGF
jgi:hypothetical protein